MKRCAFHEADMEHKAQPKTQRKTATNTGSNAQ